MMGKGHAVSGAAAWIAVTSTAPLALGVEPLPAQSVLIGALVTAGAALLPDIDHHSGTIAHSGGIVTRGVAAAAGAASGGHRHGLHSLLAIAAFTVATMFAASFEATVPVLGLIPAGSALILLALVAFATKALKLQRGGMIKLWATSLLATVAVLWFAPAELEWLPMSVMLGVIVHLAGDFITTGGLPLLWPWIPKPRRHWASLRPSSRPRFRIVRAPTGTACAHRRGGNCRTAGPPRSQGETNECFIKWSAACCRYRRCHRSRQPFY